MYLIYDQSQYLPNESNRRMQVKRTRKKWEHIAIDLIKVYIVFIVLCYPANYTVAAIRKGRLLSPSHFTALSGDLHVQIHYNVNDTILNEKPTSTNYEENSTINVLVISRYTEAPANSNEQLILQRQRKEVVRNIPLYNDPRVNVTQISVPCQTFVRGGGLYEMKVISNLKNTISANEFSHPTNDTITPIMTTTTLVPIEDERLRHIIDVRWPSAIMDVMPDKFRTYPDHPVSITLRFPDVHCDNALHLSELPDFWLELIYYGKERYQSPKNNISTANNILFAEQVRGFPKNKTFELGCELFGLAGQYAVQLRPMQPDRNMPTIRRYLTIDWSDKFVFNVYARSIFPCDPHTGIGVLYEYPNCILEQGDRVRIYAKLRADVASLKPPTSLHYVSEQRVVKSQHALYFSCDLFSEKYIEYCFNYVSQAISGAVADVRMDCVPTLPVSDSDTGAWGPWSDWTPCSTNCLGGTRNRYRFCDSPPPRYGAKFCEGNSVQSEKCGDVGLTNALSCVYRTGSGAIHTDTNINHTAVISHEIGPGCRCGCIVHLGSSKPNRIIAGATQSCPGSSFWLIQVDGIHNIALSLNFLRLPCQMQYLKIRDGPSLSSILLTQYNGGNIPATYSATTESDSNSLLQLKTTGTQLLIEFYSGTSSWKNNTLIGDGVGAYACAGAFLANVEVAERSKSGSTILLDAKKLRTKSNNIIVQKSKYRLKFTLVHLSAVIFAAIIILISALLGAQYVVRYRKYNLAIARRRDEGSHLHTPRTSMNSLRPPSRALSTTTLLSEVIYLVKMRPKHKLRHSILRESIDTENLAIETNFVADIKFDMVSSEMHKREKEFGSNGTLVAIRNEKASSPTCSFNRYISVEDKLAEKTDAITGIEFVEEEELSSHSNTLTHNTTKDSTSIVSSGMSSICNSPRLNVKRFCKYSDCYDSSLAKTDNSCWDDIHLKKSGMQIKSNTSDIGIKEFYSPIAASLFSTTNAISIKANKEQQNRRKLLTRPISEFSLATQQELEMDYYDYNVINAGAAPGSYLGMDPAYLVWIPPFDDDVKLDHAADMLSTNDIASNELDDIDPLYEKLRERMPKYYLSSCSNSESHRNTPTNQTIITPTSDEISINETTQQTDVMNASAPYFSISYMQRMKYKYKHSKSTLSLRLPLGRCDVQTIRLNDSIGVTNNLTVSIATSDDVMATSYVEKETTVIKSPSDLPNLLALDDIQFADESENDYDNSVNILVSKTK